MGTFNPLDLTGKTILVTGASSGIGQMVAIVLSRLNARVVLTGRDAAKLSSTLALMENTHIHLKSAFAFAADDAPAMSWLKDVCTETGPLNGIVHAAGVRKTVPLRVINQK